MGKVYKSHLVNKPLCEREREPKMGEINVTLGRAVALVLVNGERVNRQTHNHSLKTSDKGCSAASNTPNHHH